MCIQTIFFHFGISNEAWAVFWITKLDCFRYFIYFFPPYKLFSVHIYWLIQFATVTVLLAMRWQYASQLPFAVAFVDSTVCFFYSFLASLMWLEHCLIPHDHLVDLLLRAFVPHTNTNERTHARTHAICTISFVCCWSATGACYLISALHIQEKHLDYLSYCLASHAREYVKHLLYAMGMYMYICMWKAHYLPIHTHTHTTNTLEYRYRWKENESEKMSEWKNVVSCSTWTISFRFVPIQFCICSFCSWLLFLPPVIVCSSLFCFLCFALLSKST